MIRYYHVNMGRSRTRSQMTFMNPSRTIVHGHVVHEHPNIVQVSPRGVLLVGHILRLAHPQGLVLVELLPLMGNLLHLLRLFLLSLLLLLLIDFLNFGLVALLLLVLLLFLFFFRVGDLRFIRVV